MIINIKDTKELDALNADKKKNNWLVWYYADWCGHCHMMKDEWEKLEKSKPNVNLARVSDKFTSDEDEIMGYPTIKLFVKKSEPIIYQGSRDMNSFKDFLKENIRVKKAKKSKKVKKVKKTKSKKSKKTN